MRALLRWLGLAREEAQHRAVARAAEPIVANLRALGLFVAAKAYGPYFVEIVASTSPKLFTTPGGKEASGVALLLAEKYDPPTLVFEEINSLTAGLGRRMAEAVLQGLAAPECPFRKIRVDDASPRGRDGLSFWRRVAAAHAWLEWEITENERGRSARDPRLNGAPSWKS
ncbi:MAG: hypothetical protein WAK01_19160 [Methylocystis sp.]